MKNRALLQSGLQATAGQIERGKEFHLSTNAPAPLLPEQAGLLSEHLQEIARNYVGARQRHGETLLEAARWMTEAKQAANHGEWLIFLKATGTSDDTAERLLNIYARAIQIPQFAESIRTQQIGASAAALLAAPSTPPHIIDQVLNAPEPMKVADIKKAIKETKQPRPTPNPKPATCARCGTERTHTRSLTTYQAGLIDAYPDRDVTLCSRCIPELLHAQRAAEQPNIPELATPLADPRSALEARGWSFVPAESPKGWFRLDHPEIGYVRQEPTIEAAIKAATGLQANYDRRARVQQEQPTRPEGLDRHAYEAAEASDRSLIAAAAEAGEAPDPAQIQVAQWQAAQAPWFETTIWQSRAMNESVEGCIPRVGELRMEQREMLAEEMNQLIITLERAIEALT